MSDELNDLASEITLLSRVWYELVNVDHHKDRDCQWNIDTVWSYGDPPKFVAYHEGYVYKRVSSEFRNMKSAMEWLRNTIKTAINAKRDWAKRAAEDDTWSLDEARSILKILDQVGWND